MNMHEITDPQVMHGSYHLERREHWLRNTIAEGINLELVLKYRQEMEEAIAGLVSTGQPWGMHLIVEGDALLTPDATEILIQVVRKRFTLGCCGTAVQLKHPHASSLIKFYWGNLYQAAEMPHCFCNSEEDAEAWLTAQIAKAQAKLQNTPNSA